MTESTQTSSPPPAPSVALGPDGRLAEEIGCRRCGYGLRGQSPDGRCPECGSPVSLSTKGDLLRFSDPEWLRRLVRGMDLVMIAMTAGVVLMFVVMVLTIVAQVLRAPVFSDYLIAASGILAFLISAVTVYGTWLLTARDPAHMVLHEGLSFRLMARWMVFAGLLSGPSNMYMSPGTGGGIGAVGTLATIVLAAGLIAGIIQAFGAAFKLLYVRQLAARIPTQRFHRRVIVILVGYVLSISIVMISSGVLVLVPGMAPGPGGPPSLFAAIVGLGACFGVVGYAGFQVAYILVLFGYRRMFNVVAAAASRDASALET